MTRAIFLSALIILGFKAQQAQEEAAMAQTPTAPAESLWQADWPRSLPPTKGAFWPIGWDI